MRLSGANGAGASAWSLAFLLTTLLWSAPAVYAKDEPTITVTEFDNPPYNLNYFKGSDVILFQEVQAFGNGPIWRSADAGATWSKVDGIEFEDTAALVMHEYDPNRAYILSWFNVHWKTEDQGETWDTFFTDAPLSRLRDHVGHWLKFHAGDPDKILFQGEECEGLFCRGSTMYTTDGFDSDAKFLRSFTQSCSWAKASELFTSGKSDWDADRILCIIQSGLLAPTTENRLMVSDNYFSAEKADGVVQEKEARLNGRGPVPGLVSLVEVKKYLLAATTSANSAEMALFVSDDAETWHRAVFPQDNRLLESSYTVLESTNYSIQIDVLTGKEYSQPMGTLLTSNSNGTYFTRNVEHTNRSPMSYVDFEKVANIQGVFLVNQVSNWEEVEEEGAGKKVKTMITFDDGRTFESCQTDDEDIHLHSVTELKNVGPVFSSPAPGLIMGNGNHGKYLKDYSDANLYISDDAGRTWIEGPKGPHKYEFGDQGSILAAVQHSEDDDVKEIKYSLDHGQKWEKASLPDGLSVTPMILTTTQDSTSLKFVLTARKGSGLFPEGYYVVSIDFEGLHERTCKESDMEDWFARTDDDGNPSCVMGHTQKYHRRKKNADCFINKEFKDPVPESDPCKCTDADFECDFNFVREGDECKPAGPVLAPEGACTNDDPEETFKGSSGWRLIPGNQCKRKDGKQKDDKKKWKCADSHRSPSNSSGEVDVYMEVFKGDFDKFEKHYLERGEYSDPGDETIIARPIKMSYSVAGEIFVTHDHGKTWAIPKELEGEAIFEIVTHPYIKERAFFLTTKEKVYYTTDRGRSIDSFKVKDPLDPSYDYSPLSFHPNRPDWLIWHGQKCQDGKCYLQAELSIDRGDNWQTLKRHVERCEFTGSSAYSFRNETQIVCSAREREGNEVDNNPLQLLVMDQFQDSLTVALENVKSFATMSEFIVVATENQTAGSLQALASINGRDYAPAHFPYNFQVSHQNAYTVLDSSTHAVNLFVAVETEMHQRYGSILKSNSNGTSYVLSAEGVNCDDGYYVDYEKMLGLEGVALINTVEKRNSKTGEKRLQTRISHNDGAEWTYLPPPKKSSDGKKYSCESNSGTEACALHLHGYTERVDHKKTYSSEGAVGLMFGIGNVGSYLSDATEADTFMTDDAGLSWKEVKKGRWTWSFGDRGSVIVLGELYTKTRTVSYSLDRGQTWDEKEISDSDILIDDISTLRSGASRSFIVWGRQGDRVFTAGVDFSGLMARPCELVEDDAEKSDYELWSPKHPLQPNGCLFGHKKQYLRKKQDRQCYNEDNLQQVYKVQNCECTRSDFECDYNYELDNHNNCVLVSGLEPLDPERVCRENPDEFEYYEPSGFRRIPLTTCKGGVELDKARTAHPCPGHQEEFERRRGASGVAIFFAVVIPIVAAAGVGWWVYRNRNHTFRGQIRLGEQSSLDNDSPWVKYPVMAVSAAVALLSALPIIATSVWHSASAALGRLRGGRGRGGGGGYSWLPGGGGNGTRRFTTRDSFARGRGDYAIVDEDEGELLGDDSDDEV
ncbi:vacuolar protein sorting [Xylariomycetidae sp. FL0641]|nr:vacuolar protein sorting [Xylariomycetidae sp. FL0641]